MSLTQKETNDRISTVEESGKRRWQYAMQPKGRLYNIRTLLSFFYLAVFFTLPFIKYKGTPLFLFNFPERTFILFGKVFLPQDLILLGVAMLIFILFIVIFTLAYGRVFCGWACPQTIFLEMVFRKIEYWIEGPAHKQKIADKSPLTGKLLAKKILKHVIYFAISFLIANTFLAYIIGIDELKKIISEPVSKHLFGFVSIIIFTGVFYAVFAFVREIVCIVVCPYGRLQSVLLDKNSVVVAYDYPRGEPRSKKRSEDAGDCIDCHMCVNVCPTGIDIRNGTQLECVNCTACIDACNMMMAKVNRPPDLIKFASENNIANNEPVRFTARMKMYTAALLVLIGLFAYMLIRQTKIDAEVFRVAGQVLQENTDGTISNLYRIKITNKSRESEPVKLRLGESNGATIQYIGNMPDRIAPGKQIEQQFFIKRDRESIKQRKETMKIDVLNGKETMASKDVIFIGEY